MSCRRIGLAAVMMGSLSASAFAQSYGDFPGANPNDPDIFGVIETSDDGVSRFSRPTRAGNSLLFFPSNFSAVSNGGGVPVVTSATISMEVVAAPGTVLGELIIHEFGDWQLTGLGSAATSVSVGGNLLIQDLVPGTNAPIQDSLAMTPAMPLDLASNGAGGGVWDGLIQMDLTSFGLTRIFLEFTATLSASSEAGTAALVQRKVSETPSINPAIMIEVPTPGAGAILALGGLIGLRRRR